MSGSTWAGLAAATLVATILFGIVNWCQGRKNADKISRIQIGNQINKNHTGDKVTNIFVGEQMTKTLEYATRERRWFGGKADIQTVLDASIKLEQAQTEGDDNDDNEYTPSDCQ